MNRTQCCGFLSTQDTQPGTATRSYHHTAPQQTSQKQRPILVFHSGCEHGTAATSIRAALTTIPPATINHLIIRKLQESIAEPWPWLKTLIEANFLYHCGSIKTGASLSNEEPPNTSHSNQPGH